MRLACVSRASRVRLACVSRASRVRLARVSRVSRACLACVSSAFDFYLCFFLAKPHILQKFLFDYLASVPEPRVRQNSVARKPRLQEIKGYLDQF